MDGEPRFDETVLTEFKRIYSLAGQARIQRQTPFLAKLGKYYMERGRSNPRERWTDILRAHSLFNSCAIRDPSGQWKEEAFEVQKLYWNDEVAISFQDHTKTIGELKSELLTIRGDCSKWLISPTKEVARWTSDIQILNGMPEDELYSTSKRFVCCMKVVSKLCNQKMVEFSRHCVTNAVELVGDSPCKFTVAAIGSMARGETTPYSDLEFIFLLSEKNVQTMPYFEKLAMTCYFIIGNLGETALKYMNIKELRGWFNDRAKSGFKIDGLQECAGNIPTGNGALRQKNQFILTPEQLKRRYKLVASNPVPSDSIKGDLTAMLASTILVYGDKDLLDDFEQFRDQYKPNTKRLRATRKMLTQDLLKYEGYMEDQRFMDIKKEIYRYPTLFLLNLKILHQVNSSNTWVVINDLQIKNIIHPKLACSLKFLLSAALYVRLAMYLHHDSQYDQLLLRMKDYRQQLLPISLHLHQATHFWAVRAKSVSITEMDNRSSLADLLNHPLWKPVSLDPLKAGIVLHKSLGNIDQCEQYIRLAIQTYDGDVPIWLKLIHVDVLSANQQYQQAIEMALQCLRNRAEAQVHWETKILLELKVAVNYLYIQRNVISSAYALRYDAEFLMNQEISIHSKLRLLKTWAWVNTHVNQVEKAEKMLTEALKLSQSRNHYSSMLECTHLLMVLYNSMGRMKEAEGTAVDVLNIAKDGQCPIDNAMAEMMMKAHVILLYICKDRDDYKTALQHGYLSLELQRCIASNDLNLTIIVLKDISFMHMAINEFEAALFPLANLTRVLELLAKIVVNVHPSVLSDLEMCKIHMTSCFLLSGHMEEAINADIDAKVARYTNMGHSAIPEEALLGDLKITSKIKFEVGFEDL